MLVLGIGDHVSCGSALVRDGRLISAITDERLVREKMVFGVPRESIRENLRSQGVQACDIDAVAVATRNQHLIEGYVDFKEGWFGLQRGKFKQALFEVASDVSKLRRALPFLDSIYYLMRQPAFRRRRSELPRILRDEFGIDAPVHFLDHHFCHVTSAYYTSGYRDATVFSIDGGGDGCSCKVYDAVDGQFRELCAVSSFDSLGTFYSYITQICGFKAGRHEGKITGMAAYGEPEYVPILRKLLIQENGHLKNVGNVFFLSALRELQRVLPPDFSHKNLAASVQVYAEELVVGMVRHWLAETGHGQVALAGGVCSNVKINQRVHELPEVESVFVHPGMPDDGMPVGAALGLYHQLSGEKYEPSAETMPHVYLGPEYTDGEIDAALKAEGVHATRYENVEQEIARLLADNAIVARFNGRMEYGPRALGNRTILYQPTDSTVTYWLNDALKRTEFMPFAPVVMTEHAEKCFVGLQGAEDTARFMTITFDCTDWMVENCPAVVHVDRTARPQLVSSEDNPSMYRILDYYHQITGLPVLINTSYNMHEEPIVCTPQDAIRAFQQGHLDYLAIGNWIAKSPSPIDRTTDSASYEEKSQSPGPGPPVLMGPMRPGQRSAGLAATTALAVIAIVVLVGLLAFLGRGKIITAIELARNEGPAELYYRAKGKLPWTWPNISWPTASPETQSMDSAKLDALRDTLAAKDTKAFLIARGGHLVYEYYSPDWGNRRHSIAAMGKGATASMVLLRALTIGAIGLNDPLAKYVPEWLDDPVRSQITVRQIVSHSSGMDDVNFLESQAGWKLEYLDNPDRRFRMAIDSVPIIYEPGERYSYSGVAFHVLAYALARALEPYGVSDMRAWLKQEIMQPLDVPGHDWQISYGEAYQVDGMRLYSLGSGGAYTARALARIGQLLLEGGQWNGQQLFDPQWVDAMLRYAGSPPDRQTDHGEPAAGIGVWVNCDGFWPSLPLDGVIAAGASQQLLAVIPSLDMVVVRFGDPLGADQWEGDFWEVLDGALFRPLTSAVLDAPLKSLTQSCSDRA